MVAELRFAIRRLYRHPGRGVAMGLTLALGVGATAAAFAAIDGVLLQDLPVEDQGKLVVVWRASDRTSIELPFSGPAFDALSRGATSFARLAGYSAWGALPALVEAPGDSYALNASYIAGDFFGVLGARPAHGRLLRAEDDTPDGVPVGVLSYSVWQTRYGADPSIIGSSVVVSNQSLTIVGIAPRGFDYPRGTDLWYPLRRNYGDPDASVSELHLIGRMAPGVDETAVAADIRATLANDDRTRAFMPDARNVVRGFEEQVLGAVRPVLRAAFLAAGVLLLVAGANAALFLLTGGGDASHEAAVRMALGAKQANLTRRFLADALVAGFLGFIGGWVLASGVLFALVPLAPMGLPRFESVSIGWRATMFAMVSSVLLAGTTGLVAGFIHGRSDLRSSLLRGGSRVVRGTSFRRAIAGAQVGLTVVSATAAGLLVRTVHKLDGLDPGFSANDMTVVTLRVPYRWFDVPESYFTALEGVVGELERHPAIIAARPSLGPPLQQRLEVRLRAEDQSDEQFQGNPAVAVDAVLPGHFRGLGIAIRAGRGLTEADNRPDADPVVVVDEALARALWPSRDPVGQRLVGYPGQNERIFTVVGVSAATRYRELLAVHPRAYYPMRLLGNSPPSALLVRTTEPDVPVQALVAHAFATRDPRVGVLSVRRATDVLREPTAGRRFAATVLMSFACATLLLAGLGIFTVFTVIVNERMREMGVRRALGAQQGMIVSLVLRTILVVAVTGAAVGAVAATWVGHLVESLLFGVSPIDPTTLVVVVTASIALALLAGALPATRAASTDPAVALRAD